MVTNLLKNYKRNVADIELAKIKIGEWKGQLIVDAITINDLYPQKRKQHLGNKKNTSPAMPTEESIIRAEAIKEKIKEWIKEEQQRIRKLKKQVKVIDILLESLSEENRFIMELKFKEQEKWHIITRKFNKKFRDDYDDYITQSGIKKKYLVIIEEIDSHLSVLNLKI